MADIRLAKDTRVLFGLEATRDSDTGITKLHVLPLAGEAGVNITQDPIDIPNGMGDGLPDAQVQGLPQFTGSIPLNLDFKLRLFVERAMWTGYASVGAGTAYWHEYFEDVTTYGARPYTAQIQFDFLESTAQYLRGKSVFLQSLDERADVAGGAQYTMTVLGNGRVVETDILTDLALSATNHGLGGANYFHGGMTYEVDGVEHVVDSGLSAFSCQTSRPVSREDGPFSGNGVAGDMSIGVLTMTGEIGMKMRAGGTGPTANLNFYSDAKNHKVVTLHYMMANGPVNTTCTSYQYTQIKCYIYPMAPKPVPSSAGQAAGLKYTQRWAIARMDSADDMKFAGEYHGPTRGTYNITASDNVLGVKIDGGATISTTLTNGAARTVDQVVTNLMANGSFSAVATADNWHGWLRIRSKTKGSTSSVQIDTAVANTAHALFGFTNVARAGRSNCVARRTYFTSGAAVRSAAIAP